MVGAVFRDIGLAEDGSRNSCMPSLARVMPVTLLFIALFLPHRFSSACIPWRNGHYNFRIPSSTIWSEFATGVWHLWSGRNLDRIAWC
jgi:hypothetical protein